ncbi:hypothetical protein DL98DRAFT_536250 [Cadophora sp. DSE1049]|nr:hypothetical protein DL98DRAFT_536250 [Cadophora sp. DSE1049]
MNTSQMLRVLIHDRESRPTARKAQPLSRQIDIPRISTGGYGVSVDQLWPCDHSIFNNEVYYGPSFSPLITAHHPPTSNTKSRMISDIPSKTTSPTKLIVERFHMWIMFLADMTLDTHFEFVLIKERITILWCREGIGLVVVNCACGIPVDTCSCAYVEHSLCGFERRAWIVGDRIQLGFALDGDVGLFFDDCYAQLWGIFRFRLPFWIEHNLLGLHDQVSFVGTLLVVDLEEAGARRLIAMDSKLKIKRTPGGFRNNMIVNTTKFEMKRVNGQ